MRKKKQIIYKDYNQHIINNYYFFIQTMKKKKNEKFLDAKTKIKRINSIILFLQEIKHFWICISKFLRMLLHIKYKKNSIKLYCNKVLSKNKK